MAVAVAAAGAGAEAGEVVVVIVVVVVVVVAIVAVAVVVVVVIVAVAAAVVDDQNCLIVAVVSDFQNMSKHRQLPNRKAVKSHELLSFRNHSTLSRNGLRARMRSRFLRTRPTDHSEARAGWSADSPTTKTETARQRSNDNHEPAQPRPTLRWR